MKIKDKEFIKLMLPFMISTATQPILSATDIAVIGYISNKNYISAVAIGSLIFNTLYWIFGFLRVGATAYSSQDLDRDLKSSATIFFRMIFIAFIVAILFIFFKSVIFNLFIYYLNPPLKLQYHIYRYYNILIFGAPFVLLNYVILGWLMGKKKVKESLIIQIGGNILNIFLDFYFVRIINLDILGVAKATLISQIFSFIMSLVFISDYKYYKYLEMRLVINKDKIKELLIFNKNLILRTILLLFHNNLLMNSSIKMGENILTTNTILFQIINIIGYLFDGIANTASVFSGRAKGKKDIELLNDTINKSLLYGAISMIILTVIYYVFYERIFVIFTNIPELLKYAEKYKLLVILYPFSSFIGLILYGVFTGISKTDDIFKSTLKAFIIFFIVWNFMEIIGDYGIWYSILIFYIFRGIFLLKKINKLQEVIYV